MMRAAQDLVRLRRHLLQYGQLEAHTLFECPACDQRQLGRRQCPDCRQFCRAMGLAAECSECGEPILLIDLFQLEVPPPV